VNNTADHRPRTERGGHTTARPAPRKGTRRTPASTAGADPGSDRPVAPATNHTAAPPTTAAAIPHQAGITCDVSASCQ
jgi:hypothetical protein